MLAFIIVILTRVLVKRLKLGIQGRIESVGYTHTLARTRNNARALDFVNFKITFTGSVFGSDIV